MTSRIRRFTQCGSGATAIEYALIASLIALVIIGAVTVLGSNVRTMYSNVSNGVSSAGSSS